MEYAPYSDLESCVDGPIPEDEVRVIAEQVTTAIHIMYENYFLHRDLKPNVCKLRTPRSQLTLLQNILVFRKPPNAPRWHVKIGDFGVSKLVRPADITDWKTGIEHVSSAPEMLDLLEGEPKRHVRLSSFDFATQRPHV